MHAVVLYPEPHVFSNGLSISAVLVRYFVCTLLYYTQSVMSLEMEWALVLSLSGAVLCPERHVFGNGVGISAVLVRCFVCTLLYYTLSLTSLAMD